MIIKTFSKLYSSTVGGPLRYSISSSLYRRLLTRISPTSVVPFQTSAYGVGLCTHSVSVSTVAPHRAADVQEKARAFPGEYDQHNGIHVNVEHLPDDVSLDDFNVQLEGERKWTDSPAILICLRRSLSINLCYTMLSLTRHDTQAT